VYIVRFGGDPDEFRARQEAELLRLRDRYVRHLVATADVDEATAERVIAVLFDHRWRTVGCAPAAVTRG
jgi:hypothetical protein